MNETKKKRAGWYYDNYLEEPRKWVWGVAMLVTIVVAVSVVMFLTNADNRQKCYRYAEVTLHDAQYTNGECFVRIDGHWVLKSQIRVIESQP